MVTGFRTAEAGGGLLDGSIYSFSPAEQTARRFKRKQGDSDADTLKSTKLVFFLPPHMEDEIYRQLHDKGHVPMLYWHKANQSPYSREEDAHAGLAIKPDGSLRARPEPDAIPVVRLKNAKTGEFEQTAFVLKAEPQTGLSPLELNYRPGSIPGNIIAGYHLGHPVAEIFNTLQALSEKIALLKLPVVLDPATGHLSPPVFRRLSSNKTTASIPVFQRQNRHPPEWPPVFQRTSHAPAQSEPLRVFKRTSKPADAKPS